MSCDPYDPREILNGPTAGDAEEPAVAPFADRLRRAAEAIAATAKIIAEHASTPASKATISAWAKEAAELAAKRPAEDVVIALGRSAASAVVYFAGAFTQTMKEKNV